MHESSCYFHNKEIKFLQFWVVFWNYFVHEFLTFMSPRKFSLYDAFPLIIGSPGGNDGQCFPVLIFMLVRYVCFFLEKVFKNYLACYSYKISPL